MHRRRAIRIISVIFIVIYILNFASLVFAQEIDPLQVVGNGPNPTSSGGVSTLYEFGNIILGIVQYIGAGVAVVALLILAMKYMYSSPGDKAEVKKKLIPFIIGGVLVFGAVQLVKLVEIFTKDIT